MANCSDYISADDLKTGKQAILHIEHVAKSRDANGNPALEVTDEIRGESVTNTTLDGLFQGVGFKPADGSFEAGGTIVHRWETLLYQSEGQYYQWMGPLPKVVPAGSTPASTGGISPTTWVNQTDLTLRSDLASSANAKGGSLVFYKRKALATFVQNVQTMLDSQYVNIWEFADVITSKPTPNDPNTWDWTPAFEAACNFIGHTSLNPGVSGGCVVIPPIKKDSVYRMTEVVVPIDVAIFAYGSTIVPVSQAQSHTHLFKFMGMNKVAGLQLAMDYSLTYDCAIWCRGRNIDFTSCSVWFSKNAVTIGDPAWSTTPTDGWLGDSEISFTNCQFNWCLRTCTAYGLNTIVTFGGGSRCYANRGSIPSGHPNAATWLTAPMGNFLNYGALIYVVGAFIGTFERDVPSLTARVMPVSRTDYVNSYGRFFIEGTHIETSMLYYAPGETSPSADVITKALVVHNCHGHVATSPADGYWINASSQLTQGIDIRSCGFYGSHGVTPTRTKLISAPGAPVHITKDSFMNIAGEFKDACVFTYPFDLDNIMLVNAFGSAQTITTASSTLAMPNNNTIDLNNSARGSYYTNGSGLFTAAVELNNVNINIDLRYVSPSSLNQVTMELVVAGVSVDTVVAVGGYSRVILHTRRIAKGATFLIRMVGSASYTLDGSVNTKVSLTANV